MTKTVLVQKSSSIYDDAAGDRYHFPKKYLDRVKAASGDWVVFYTPVKDAGVSIGGRGCYFATAKISEITPDLSRDDHYYATVMSNTYADFSSPVPRIVDGKFIEPKMQGKGDSANVGVALQSVRPISEDVFQRIIKLAWPDVDVELPRFDSTDKRVPRGVSEDQLGFEYEVERDVVSQLLNRKVRDPRFRSAVLHAYDKRCAITGWSFVNGGGRAEVEAAHIRPVEYGGSDRICNGLALSGTVHWMFDRGLMGIADNDEIIISRKVNDRHSVERLINSTGKLVRPHRKEHQPHSDLIRWHREFHQLVAA